MWKSSRWIVTAAAAGAMALSVASPAQAAPTPVALWQMDSVPAMVDSAGGDNNGSTSNVTMSADGYYTFNGGNSIASVPHQVNLNPGPAPITVEVRINATKAPAAGETFDLIRKGTSSTAGGYYKIELKTTSTGAVNAACIFKDTTRVVGRAMGRIPTTGWVTLTCSKTATTVTLAVNGAIKKTTIKTVGATSNSAGVFIGGKGDGTDVFLGLFDYASIAIG